MKFVGGTLTRATINVTKISLTYQQKHIHVLAIFLITGFNNCNQLISNWKLLNNQIDIF